MALFEYKVIEARMEVIRKEIATGDTSNQPQLPGLYQDWLRATKSNQRLMAAVCRDLDR